MSNQFEWKWDNENTRFGEKLTTLWPARYIIHEKQFFPKNVDYLFERKFKKTTFG